MNNQKKYNDKNYYNFIAISLIQVKQEPTFQLLSEYQKKVQTLINTLFSFLILFNLFLLISII